MMPKFIIEEDLETVFAGKLFVENKIVNN